MGQSIHCGVDGIPLRQANRQLRIEDGGKGHELGIEDLALAVGRGPTDDGGDGGLAAGAGRGGNRNERHRLLFSPLGCRPAFRRAYGWQWLLPRF